MYPAGRPYRIIERGFLYVPVVLCSKAKTKAQSKHFCRRNPQRALSYSKGKRYWISLHLSPPSEFALLGGGVFFSFLLFEMHDIRVTGLAFCDVLCCMAELAGTTPSQLLIGARGREKHGRWEEMLNLGGGKGCGFVWVLLVSL
jgi:hypothetical protein